MHRKPRENNTCINGWARTIVFSRRLQDGDRRNGKPGSLARGFFVWNSEVGSTSFGVATFLFDYVCCNRIVWGPQEYREVRFRHTASAPDKWIEQVAPAIEAYANSSTANIVQAVASARSKRVADVKDFLSKRFTKSEVSGIIAAHTTDEDRPIETIWDVATGVTAYARGLQWQDQRVRLERQAGDILDLAA